MWKHSYGGINLEDIAKPKCFDILERLRTALDIPVWHDDQQGTAAVVLAGLLNALKVVGKTPDEDLRAKAAAIITRAREETRVLMGHGLIPLPV